jgi:hypothetical protein
MAEEKRPAPIYYIFIRAGFDARKGNDESHYRSRWFPDNELIKSYSHYWIITVYDAFSIYDSISWVALYRQLN